MGTNDSKTLLEQLDRAVTAVEVMQAAESARRDARADFLKAVRSAYIAAQLGVPVPEAVR